MGSTKVSKHDPGQSTTAKTIKSSPPSQIHMVNNAADLKTMVEASQRAKAKKAQWNRDYQLRKKMGPSAVGKRGRPPKQLDPSDAEYARYTKDQKYRRNKYQRDKANRPVDVQGLGPAKKLKGLGFDLHEVDCSKMAEHSSSSQGIDTGTATDYDVRPWSTPPLPQALPSGPEPTSELDTLIEKQSWGDLAKIAKEQKSKLWPNQPRSKRAMGESRRKDERK
jgi:hypothetical protein